MNNEQALLVLYEMLLGPEQAKRERDALQTTAIAKLIEQLREPWAKWPESPPPLICRQAADALEQMATERNVLREAMQHALDALNDYEKHTGWGSSAAEALRVALEAPPQQAIAKLTKGKINGTA
jgi:hypothetical protein